MKNRLDTIEEDCSREMIIDLRRFCHDFSLVRKHLGSSLVVATSTAVKRIPIAVDVNTTNHHRKVCCFGVSGA